MKLPLRSEEAIGLECAWPERLLASVPKPRAARRWGRWIAAGIVFAALAYLGWRLGLAGWPEIALKLRTAG